MKVTIKWHEGKYPSFNVSLHQAEGQEPFLEVKGCRIMQSNKGEFVSWPATKNEKTGKWWNHCYASEAFNDHVKALAKASMPQQAPQQETVRQASVAGSFDDFDDDIPF